MGFSLRCQCGAHVLEVPPAMLAQFFGDATLGLAPWPLQVPAGRSKPAPGDHVVPLGELLPWFNRASSALNGRRDTLPELFTLLGRQTNGEVVIGTSVFLEAPRIGLVAADADATAAVETTWDDSGRLVTPLEVQRWREAFGLPGPLAVPHIRCLDPKNAMIDPDWLQGVLWRTPFQLRRGDLLTFFEAEFNELHALALHVARTGESLTARVS